MISNKIKLLTLVCSSCFLLNTNIFKAQQNSTINNPLNKVYDNKASDLLTDEGMGELTSFNFQIPEGTKESKVDISKILKNISFGGVFQAQYVNSLTSGVDYKGKHFGDAKHSSNSFDVRRMRVFLQAAITDKMKVVVLTNLADYKTDPKNKVLENAYLSYNLNKYLNFRVGQFRPMVSPENMYAVDVVKSLDFSNLYYDLGANGWGSFQVGLDVSGKVDLGKIPMSYSVAVLNGNGKNKTDSDSGKQFFGRTAFLLSKEYKVNVGLNGGWGKVSDKDVYLASIDASAVLPLSSQWAFSLEAQAAQATNHNQYFGLPADKREGNLSDYRLKGWYVLPNLRYLVNKKNIRSIEFSCRYEQGEANKFEDNLRQTITPALSFEFLKDYQLRLTIAMQMNQYEHNVQNSAKYNSNILTTQLQARF